MIRIHKPTILPAKLTIDGKRKRRSNCTSYSRNSKDYETGAKKFEFDRSIYAHESVKQALIEAQHQKCCFCERLIGSDGDVEHFRPKQAYKQATGEPLQRPGYYWLAYEWDNLYLSCAACNQRHKQNLFPLQNPIDRATNHKQNTDLEKPLFIDFGKENPEEFIGFRGEFAYSINTNQRGKVTINSLKLNDQNRALPEARLQQLQKLRGLNQVVLLAIQRPHDQEFQELAMEAKDTLEKSVLDSAEFAAAARCAISSSFAYVNGSDKKINGDTSLAGAYL